MRIELTDTAVSALKSARSLAASPRDAGSQECILQNLVYVHSSESVRLTDLGEDVLNIIFTRECSPSAA